MCFRLHRVWLVFPTYHPLLKTEEVSRLFIPTTVINYLRSHLLGPPNLLLCEICCSKLCTD